MEAGIPKFSRHPSGGQMPSTDLLDTQTAESAGPNGHLQTAHGAESIHFRGQGGVRLGPQE